MGFSPGWDELLAGGQGTLMLAVAPEDDPAVLTSSLAAIAGSAVVITAVPTLRTHPDSARRAFISSS